ncbi:MAG: S53 family peptidase [Thermoplasmata archaeon]|nr:S53 family peptidase [Thermoplasmata archaeon]
MKAGQVVAWVLLVVLIPGPLAVAPGAMAAGHVVRWVSDAVHPAISMSAVVHPLGEVCSSTSLCPATVRTAYNVTPLLSNASTDGAGQAVVIVDACGDPKMGSDLATFDAVNSLPVANLTVYFPQGTPCKDAGWSLETSLDVEWAHVMAPSASLHLVVGARPTNADLFGAWNYSLAHRLGNQISDSWAGNGACPHSGNSLVKAAAAQGVTILASSGDGGSWGVGTGAVSQYPADCAPVLAVGGTTLNVNSTSGAYVSESAWSGSGGGYVAKATEKFYQSKVTIYDPYTDVAKPDVAAVADPLTGVWVYNERDGGWFTVGGTSVACPLWAGFLADANDWRASQALGPAGFIGAFLYLQVYGVNGTSSLYAHDFHDVTSGSNGWSAGPGWDAATGLGSFDAYNLAKTIGTSPSA